MEVTEQEERGVVDSDVEGFSIALADLDPVRDTRALDHPPWSLGCSSGFTGC